MKFVCQRTDCLKIVGEDKIIRMPWSDEKYWCEECYSEWANECDGRHKLKCVKRDK